MKFSLSLSLSLSLSVNGGITPAIGCIMVSYRIMQAISLRMVMHLDLRSKLKVLLLYLKLTLTRKLRSDIWQLNSLNPLLDKAEALRCGKSTHFGKDCADAHECKRNVALWLHLKNQITPYTNLTCHFIIGWQFWGDFIIIKWSKTIQDRKETRTINVPYLGDSQICPIVALKTMLCHIPGSENDPLFMITKKGIPMVLTDSVARKHLKKVSQLLHIQPPLTFHAFRRAASSWAFQHGVPLQHIQAHGTWKSNAVWSYLRALPSSSSPVAQTFSKHLHT